MLGRDLDTVHGSCVDEDGADVTEVDAQRHRAGTFTRPLFAKIDQALARNVREALAAKFTAKLVLPGGTRSKDESNSSMACERIAFLFGLFGMKGVPFVMGGRLLFHIMGAIAEFERSLISDRTRAGMAAAKARGQHLGRERKIADDDALWAYGAISSGRMAPYEVARVLRVSMPTLYRSLRRTESLGTVS